MGSLAFAAFRSSITPILHHSITPFLPSLLFPTVNQRRLHDRPRSLYFIPAFSKREIAIPSIVCDFSCNLVSVFFGKRQEQGLHSFSIGGTSENAEEGIRRPVVSLSVHRETLFLDLQPLRDFEKRRSVLGQTYKKEVMLLQIRSF